MRDLPSRLEINLQRKFNIPGRTHRAEYLAECARRSDAIGRRAEAGMISKIKEFRSEVDILGLADSEFLSHAEIPVRIARRRVGAVACVSESAGRGKHKSIDIEPVRQSGVTDIAAGNPVRTATATRILQRYVSGADGNGKSAVPGDDAADIPTAQDSVGKRI